MTDAPATRPIPVFAVVGRVNKGKSSVVATLAEDPTVAIEARPGTTRACTRFPVEVDGRVLFELVDTPGFEEADRALDWLRAVPVSPADRPARVAALVATFAGTDHFVEERTLLAPILAGASVLYVVDAAHPYRQNHQAEMEILRWTGRPGMALINHIATGDHTETWRAALKQSFDVVRIFDAHHAGFAERIGLLRAFRALDEDAGPALEAAIEAMLTERRHRRAEAAATLTDLLVDALTLTLTETASDAADLDTRRAELEQRFHARLRDREQAARRRIEQLYHHHTTWTEVELDRPVYDEDLFAERTWQQLGLTGAQIVVGATGSGAIAGGTIDAMVGGASFLAGTAIGAAVGLVGGLAGLSRRYARATPGEKAKALGRRLTGQSGRPWRIGPHQNPNFAFVLLDRALLHYQAVATRAHARQDPPRIAGDGPSSTLPPETRKALAACFDRLRKTHDDPDRDARDRLYRQITDQLEALDPAAPLAPLAPRYPGPAHS